MSIQRIPVGSLQANCYLVSKGREVIIIDPGDELEKIEQAIEDKEVVGILVTHHHFDHIGALDIKIYTGHGEPSILGEEKKWYTF